MLLGGNFGTCGGGSWIGFKYGDAIGSISSTLHGAGTASITFGNCWQTGEVKLVIDGNVISSAGPHSMITTEFQFEDSNIKLEEHNSAIIRFDDFDIPSCVARKKDIVLNDDKILFRNPTPNFSSKPRIIQLDYQKRINHKPNFLTKPTHSNQGDRMSKLKSKYFRHHDKFDWEEELLLNPQYRRKPLKRSIMKRNITQHKATIGKTNAEQITQLKSVCEGKEGTSYQKSSIVCNHLASSVEGLRVKLNPNLEEYKTDAVKNNFMGFKYLVHSPYDFPYVEEVGKAMSPSITSYIGFLGFHSWITDGADTYTCDRFKCPKNCASKRDIELDVFEDYTRTNCVFECQAKSMFQNCGCLPYQYPEFHLVNTGIWKNVSSTACNYTQLICLSRAKGT